MAALATELGASRQRLEERLGVGASASLADRSRPPSRTRTRRWPHRHRKELTLAEDLAAARKFMLQTAQLGWLNQEAIPENANGIRKMTTASQELDRELREARRRPCASSPRRLASQLKELATRLDAIQSKVENIK